MIPLYFINLDRSPGRLASMWGQLASLPNLPFAVTRIPGVDGANIALPNLGIVDEKAFDRRHHAYLRRGEIGCFLSHVRALNAFLTSGAPLGIILEDDALLGPEFPAVVRELVKCANAWDLVKLHASHVAGSRLRLNMGSHRLVSLALRHGSAAAYMVNRFAAERLVAGLLPMTVPYDHEFDRAWKYGIRLRCVLPLPVGRLDFASTIVNTGLTDPHARPVNAKMHKRWYRQMGMVAFRGLNDVARVVHELKAG